MPAWQLAFFAAAFAFLAVMSFWQIRDFQLVAEFTTRNWIKLYQTSYFWSAFGYTLWMAIVAAVAASLIAFPLAYWMAFILTKRVRIVALGLLITPFFTSYVVKVYSWRLLLTGEGIVNALLNGIGLPSLPMLNTTFATVVGVLTLSFPLVVLLQYFSLSNVDRTLVEAAYNLGCRPLSVIFRIVVPSAKTGIALAAVFTFILGFGDFISPSFLGGNKPPTMSNLLVDAVKSGNNYPRAAVIAVTMVVTLSVAALATLGYVYRLGRARS